jgi:hypothetical protein
MEASDDPPLEPLVHQCHEPAPDARYPVPGGPRGRLRCLVVAHQVVPVRPPLLRPRLLGVRADDALQAHPDLVAGLVRPGLHKPRGRADENGVIASSSVRCDGGEEIATAIAAGTDVGAAHLTLTGRIRHLERAYVVLSPAS